jgi:hypothetical protein
VAPVHTLGFDSAEERANHYKKHRVEFYPQFADESAYEDAADEFLGAPLPAGIHECTNREGRRLRFCRVTNRLGSVSADNRIMTFFVAHPSRHGFGTNIAYFMDCCNS